MFTLLCSTAVLAQDVIVKKDGSTVVCRVIELTSSEIVYKKWSDLNGSNYIMNRSDASAINYQNGKKVNLSEAGTNLYAPGNQNDGVQQYNDRALLGIDMVNQNINTKIKRLKKWGWICGIAAGIGVITGGVGQIAMDTEKAKQIFLIAGGGCALTGSIAAICCFGKAKRLQRDYLLQSYSIIQKEIPIGNGSFLSASVDILSDRSNVNNSLGLGLHYSF